MFSKNLILILLFFSIIIKAQEKPEKNWAFFKTLNVQIGMCQNKATLDSYYGFRINYKPSYLISTEAINFKNLYFNVGFGYRTKTIYGFGNSDGHPRFKKQFNATKNNLNYWDSIQNININYLTIDGSMKCVFFKKKKINLFILIGPRFNILVNYEYQNENKDKKGNYTTSLNRDALPNLKPIYYNMVYGIGLNYKLYEQLSISLQYELNDDLRNHPASHYMPFGWDPFPLHYGLRFQTQSLYLGASYNF